MTPEVEKKRRELFEAWILSSYMSDGDRDLVARDNDGEYFSVGVAERWEMYNAALDSIEIVLPDVRTATDIAYFNADVIDAITATGLGLRIK